MVSGLGLQFSYEKLGFKTIVFIGFLYKALKGFVSILEGLESPPF